MRLSGFFARGRAEQIVTNSVRIGNKWLGNNTMRNSQLGVSLSAPLEPLTATFFLFRKKEGKMRPLRAVRFLYGFAFYFIRSRFAKLTQKFILYRLQNRFSYIELRSLVKQYKLNKNLFEKQSNERIINLMRIDKSSKDTERDFCRRE